MFRACFKGKLPLFLRRGRRDRGKQAEQTTRHTRHIAHGKKNNTEEVQVLPAKMYLKREVWRRKLLHARHKKLLLAETECFTKQT